ncbi:MAG: hypothetical protein HC915_18415, partial [Anaerolineae bacterium]|nr:hypothetical protein [Anaerolineae bacterium]
TGRYAAFLRGSTVYRWNLERGDPLPLGQAAEVAAPLWVGEALVFWQEQTTPQGEFRLVRVAVTPQRRIEQVVYRGPRPEGWLPSPVEARAALSFRPASDQSYVEVHGPRGLFWSSAERLPGAYVQLPLALQIAWTRDAQTLHLLYSEGFGPLPRSLALDMRNGRSLLPPEERAIFVGDSPDGQWWLYEVGEDPLQTSVNRLFLWAPAVAGYVLVTEGRPLYTGQQYPSHRFYVWSD